MPARGVKSPVAASKKEALVREIQERVADKWTLLVIDALEGKSEVQARLRNRRKLQSNSPPNRTPKGHG
jgi:DNA-binding HxlR family transcriptional regulator